MTALFLLTLLLHGYRFWSIGTEGTDAVYYQRMGIQWSQGLFNLECPERPRPHFAPALFSASALFYKLFGVHDFTFKLLNLASLAGIFFLLLRISRQEGLVYPYSLIPAGIFLFLPTVIMQSRTELSHLLSVLFVLMSYSLLQEFLQRKKTPLLVLSGLTLHAAMAVHCDLALLAPGFTALLFWERRPFARREAFSLAVREALIFSAAFFAPFMLYFWVWGFEPVIAAIHSVRIHPVMDSGKHFPELTLELLTAGLSAHLGRPLMFVLYTVLALSFFKVLKKKTEGQSAAVLIPAAVYFLLFELLITRNRLEPLIRVLIPLLPFVCLYLAGSIQAWCGDSRRRAAATVFLLFFALGVNFMPYAVPPSLSFYHSRAPVPFYQYQSLYRHVYDSIKNKLHPGNKLLIAPSQLRNDYDVFNLPFYFNGRSVSLRKCRSSQAEIDDFLRRENIQFVFIGKEWFFEKGWLKKNEPQHEFSCLAAPGEYDAALETERLLAALAPFNPVRLYKHGFYGSMYEIHVPPKETGG